MCAFKITCWALIFIFRLRFSPDILIATVLKRRYVELFSFHRAILLRITPHGQKKSHFTAPESNISHFRRTDISQSRVTKTPFTAICN